MKDPIERQAAIDVIKKYDFKSPEYMSYYLMRLKNAIKADLVDDINDIPSTEVEPVKRGKWIDDCYDPMDGGAYMITVCSNCGTPNPVSNYCPNCGAKMFTEEGEK